ncbi:MAG: hypothetical protein COW08_05010 [Ignavibacteriales bacterium CG12_big_fil_rev_8_21_14_0_65_30_8]|nr:MAG: hypothetical protein COW08_05010 [Ignavibacteriales bacterium CG12_big_fil_rev_8_21_14_0_65_30_8]
MRIKFLILTILFISGCDIFTTRDAESPNTSRSNYQTPVTPDLLISNFINSLNDKNLENYMSSFSDPNFTSKIFTFSASSAAISQYPSLANNWNVSNEEQYFSNLITKVSSDQPITLNLSNISSSPQGDSLFYTASYFINIPSISAEIESNYQGELRFSMIRDSRAIWTIYFWQDTKNSDLPSWSELKGRLY